MDIVDIIYLDCSKKENRVLLVKQTMKALKLDEKPNRDELEKYCRIIQKKYDIPIRCFSENDGSLFVSMEVEKGTYSTFVCKSYYEMMCRYILYVRSYVKSKKVKVK